MGGGGWREPQWLTTRSSGITRLALSLLVAKFGRPGLINRPTLRKTSEPSRKQGKGTADNAASHRLRTWAWGQCDRIAALHPEKCGTERIGEDESLQGYSRPSSPWLQRRVCFRKRDSRVGGTHALRAEARRGGGTREQQAQHEQQRYAMHDDDRRGGSKQ